VTGPDGADSQADSTSSTSSPPTLALAGAAYRPFGGEQRFRRHVGQVRYEPTDRVWFAVLAGQISRTRWTEVFL